MDSKLYEELCRIYLADQFGLPIEGITSRVIDNPQRPGEPDFSHQIDHYWETGSAAVLYVNIANAKWRTSDKADQGEVMAVHAVKEMIRANKALLLTSTDFTAGARGIAAQYGIGLHIVRPTFDPASIQLGDRAAMRAAIIQVANTPYSAKIVQRGMDVAERPAPAALATRPESKPRQWWTGRWRDHHPRWRRGIHSRRLGRLRTEMSTKHQRTVSEAMFEVL